jgi:hypothetical protein
MLVQTTKLITDYENNPIPQYDTGPTGMPMPAYEADGRPKHLTFRDAVSNALNNVPTGETQTPERKVDVFRITNVLYSDATADLSIKDAAFIQERCGEMLSALIYGRICEQMESASSLPSSNGSVSPVVVDA